jgi:putative SOS response-associated peptidase YedK
MHIAATSIVDRMPVVLGNKESTEMWLNAASSSNFDAILKPYEGTDLVRVLRDKSY